MKSKHVFFSVVCSIFQHFSGKGKIINIVFSARIIIGSEMSIPLIAAVVTMPQKLLRETADQR